MPEHVTCAGGRYDHVETFKHDFFAATGLYNGPEGLAVLKLGRTTPLGLLPMGWIGRFLTRRELRLYSLAHDLTGVPRLIGAVGRGGLLHAYVPGHPLGRRETVSDTFFAELADLLGSLHDRHIAYVDLNKRQNVLMGDDGKPYLIDFQISLYLPPEGWRRLAPVRWFLRRFQNADRYHYLKHKRRLRPDLLTAEEQARVGRLSPWILLHRWLFRPVTYVRRAVLRRLRRTEDVYVSGSSAK